MCKCRSIARGKLLNSICFNKITLVFMLISILLFTMVTQGNEFDHFHKNLNLVLKTYVRNGNVNYSDLKSNPYTLNQYIKETSSVSKNNFENWTRDQQLAYLINLYNAITLKLIIDNYPLKSIKNIDSPWDMKIVNLFGESITLNQLENKIIRKNYNEPRIHFVLVCAAKGCPILINEAYLPVKLNIQLDEQTKEFLLDKNKNSFNIENSEITISPIFDWYKDDFKESSNSVIEFIKPYLSEELSSKTHPGENSVINYSFYDWSLNDQAK